MLVCPFALVGSVAFGSASEANLLDNAVVV